MAANPIVGVTKLRLESTHKLSETTVHARGRITSATSATLEHTFRDLIPGFQRVVLDISNVDYIDGSGLGALVDLYGYARKTHCDLEIANPRPRLKYLLRGWLHSVFEGHEEFLGLTPD
jgi:anti-anti-sigma factor